MPVPEPLTWRVLVAVQDLVKRVRKASGFYTDMGADVRLTGWQMDRGTSPRVHICSPSDSLNDGDIGKGLRGSRTVSGDMSVIVEYVLPASFADTHREAHRGRADLVRVLRDDPALAPAGVRALRITGRRILDQPEGLPFVVAQIELTVSITETTTPLPLT